MTDIGPCMGVGVVTSAGVCSPTEHIVEQDLVKVKEKMAQNDQKRTEVSQRWRYPQTYIMQQL